MATDGEIKFYLSIKDKINSIFDVGCKYDSSYLDFTKEVHYFDPVSKYVDELKTKPNNNSVSHFNAFGLGNENASRDYYPLYEAFYDRVVSCGASDKANKIVLHIRRGLDYVTENKVTSIDFLKIDTEGHELEVLKGFGDFLTNIKIIQFEYGGTYLDSNIRLIDVINYLSERGFHKFTYITDNGYNVLTNFDDTFSYSNIVCVNKNCDIVLPF